MNSLVEVIIIGAAGWRCAALLSYERGPLKVFQRFRELLGFQHDSDGSIIAWPEHILAEAISCVWCLSIWVALGLWGVWQFSQDAVIILAAATVLIAVEQWCHGITSRNYPG